MAVRIRLKRIGAKNSPVYRVVVADSRSPRDGKFIEEIGTYQPLKKDTNFTLNLERAQYWISKGSQVSDTVWNLFLDQGIVKGDKRKVTTLSKTRREKLAKEAAEAKGKEKAPEAPAAAETPAA